jgi:hypothetical protein
MKSFMEKKMSNLIDFARKEMELAGLFDKDSDYEGMLGESVMKLIETFSDEGHSGFSAHMAINIFKKVAAFEPLTPLTGKDDEWTDISEWCGHTVYQNKRCSHVFKDIDGKAYDINGRVFREPNGACYTNRDSRVYIEFPYVPKTEYVDAEREEDEG